MFAYLARDVVVKSFKKRLINRFQEHSKMIFGHNTFGLFSEIKQKWFNLRNRKETNNKNKKNLKKILNLKSLWVVNSPEGKIVLELSLPKLDFMSFYRATVTKIEQR